MEHPRNAKGTILVVDDDPMIGRLMGTLLDQAGYEVSRIDSGSGALEALKTFAPDLILLDIDMPGLSGFETCRVIKRNPRTADTPVIFVTGSTEKHDIVAGFAAGAQDYVRKPSTKEELLARVGTHLALSKTQQELKASETRFRELSFIDDLTGFHNTRHLYLALQARLDAHPLRPVAVVFIDIDDFKRVVDTHGHINGSRALAELAAVIRPLIPEDSYGVSYGGDEFVIVLGDHDRQAGARFAERVRVATERASFLAAHGLAVQLTVSSGVAAYPDDSETLVDLLGKADRALFESKRRGKNKVLSFAELK